MKILNKILSIFSITTLILSTALIASSELFMQVNYGDAYSLQQTKTAGSINYNTSIPIKNFNFETIAKPQTSVNVNVTKTWYPWNTALKNEALNEACKDVYIVDMTNTTILRSIIESNESSQIDSTLWNIANIPNKAKAESFNVNQMKFIPTITIKRGNFNLKDSSLVGQHTKTFTSINVLMQLSLILEANIATLISNGATGNLNREQALAKKITDDFITKNWEYNAPRNFTGFYEYIAKFKTLLNGNNGLLKSEKITLKERNTLNYLLRIIQLGENYTAHYLPNEYSSTKVISETCTEFSTIQAKANNLNVLLKSAGENGLDNGKLISFMNDFDISKTIMNFDKFMYSVEQSQNNTSSGSNYWWWFFQTNYKISHLNLNKIYALKIIDKNGEASGTYANVLQFNDGTSAEAAREMNITEGLTSIPNTGSIGSYTDLVAHYDTLPTDSKTFATTSGFVDSVTGAILNEGAIVNASYEAPKVEFIANACDTYYTEDKFVNNVVFIDAEAMKIGNNQFINFTDAELMSNYKNKINEKKKNTVFITSEVYNEIKNKLLSDHLIGNYAQSLTGVKFDSANPPAPNFNNLNDVVYFYQKLIDEKDVSPSCKNLFTSSKITKPIVVYMSSNPIDLEVNIPHNPYNSYQLIMPINSILEESATIKRDSDGYPDAEVEKRLDVSGSYTYGTDAIMYNNDILQLDNSGGDIINWKPETTMVTAYYPMWKPTDTNTFNTYGPVGPFFNKQDIIVKERYEGCDLPDYDGSVAPETVGCTISSCIADTLVTVPAVTCTPGDTTCVPSASYTTYTCDDVETTEGVYGNYKSGSCFCNATIPNPSVANRHTLNISSIRANRNLQVNRYCSYDMEPIEFKLRKRKYAYSHLNDDGKLQVDGFDSDGFPEGTVDGTEDAYGVYGGMDELNGAIGGTKTIPSRASHPLTFDSTTHYEADLNPWNNIYWSTKINEHYDDVLQLCDWDNENVKLKNQEISNTNIIKLDIVEETLNNLASNTKGVAAAKILINTDRFEVTSFSACEETETNIIEDCGTEIVNKIPELVSAGITTGDILTTSYLSYLKEGSKLKFGAGIPIRKNFNRNTNTFGNGDEVDDWIVEFTTNDETWLNIRNWNQSLNSIYDNATLNNGVDNGWMQIKYNNLIYSPKNIPQSSVILDCTITPYDPSCSSVATEPVVTTPTTGVDYMYTK